MWQRPYLVFLFGEREGKPMVALKHVFYFLPLTRVEQEAYLVLKKNVF